MTNPKPPTKDGQPFDGTGKASVVLQAGQYPGESADAAIARTTLSPSTQAALTLQGWRPISVEQNINALADELRVQAKAASGNDLTQQEAMLTTQAHVLDAMFNDMARLARLNMTQYPEAFERYLRLSFKAQSQCRATIETLAEIKNPKAVAFVQQANIANGPQQVNNGVSRPVRAGVRAENSNRSNELLENAHGNKVEQGKATEGVTGNSSLATLGQVDWAEVGNWEGQIRVERA
jgi:hypothetical protein